MEAPARRDRQNGVILHWRKLLAFFNEMTNSCCQAHLVDLCLSSNKYRRQLLYLVDAAAALAGFGSCSSRHLHKAVVVPGRRPPRVGVVAHAAPFRALVARRYWSGGAGCAPLRRSRGAHREADAAAAAAEGPDAALLSGVPGGAQGECTAGAPGSQDTAGAAAVTSFQALSSLLWRCFVRARRTAPEQEVVFRASANNRARLRPPLPVEYFGNAINAVSTETVRASELLARGHRSAAAAVGHAVATHTDAGILSPPLPKEGNMRRKWETSPLPATISVIDGDWRRSRQASRSNLWPPQPALLSSCAQSPPQLCTRSKPNPRRGLASKMSWCSSGSGQASKQDQSGE